jgi:hypothetical protein
VITVNTLKVNSVTENLYRLNSWFGFLFVFDIISRVTVINPAYQMDAGCLIVQD